MTSGNTLSIRPARPEDAEAICEVLIRSIREVCGPAYGNDETLLEKWCRNKKPEIVWSWIADPENHAFVALDPAGRIAGVAAVARDAPSDGDVSARAGADFPSDGDVSARAGADFEVRLCYALPEALGKGYGHALIVRLEEVARGLGGSRLVLTSTSTARGFYERHGFVLAGAAEPRGPGWQYPMAKRL